MSEEDNTISFLAEQFRRINARFDEMGERFDRVDERLAQIERRLTASTHLEQGLVAHMASVHESMDNFRANMAAIDRRVAGLEAR
ncbi:hypothetical protein [Sphingomonas oligophenolica]|uniref:hypothetical protein n=1 Tax=Sphingomonas oligophenolica TaxID=301154 RepID=UPI0011284216|nr:hypothetical protein [Sphingomonas oligophenolica]